MNEKKYKKIEERKEAFTIILTRTMMPNEEVKKSVEINKLDNKDVEYILNEFELKMLK